MTDINPEDNLSNLSNPDVKLWCLSEAGEKCSHWVDQFRGRKFYLRRVGEVWQSSKATAYMMFHQEWLKEPE